MKNLYKILIFPLILISVNFAQQDLGDGWNLNGQIQLRSEIDGRDFSNKTHPLTFASLRTRLGVQKSFAEKITFFVQFQDSRVFGKEPSTLTSTENIDLHQGFVKLNKIFGWDWSIQAGRFEMAYGTERFFGAVGWHYVGRSFDGLRLSILPDCWNLDLFALTIKESANYIGNATGGLYSFPQEPTPASSIYGIWKQNKVSENSKFDLFGYYEVNREKIGLDTCRLNIFTLGGSYWGNFGKFSTIIEAAYQLGDDLGKDISAYLISAAGNYNFGEVKLGLGADILSGTDLEDFDTKMNTFQPTYGTNHKFYGYMDYFINIRSNTFYQGLHDFYFTANYAPEECNWNFGLYFHHFMTNQMLPVSTINEPEPKDQSILGQELDLTVKYSFVKGTTLTWGGSLFFPGNLMKAFFYPREDVAFWTYAMITANL